MAENEVGANRLAEGENRDRSGLKISRFIRLIAAAGILVILILFGVALAAALTAAETWAPVFRIFRDVFLLILILETVLVISALAVLMLQAAGFLIMLKTEVKPIIDNAREATRLSKATARFINNNAVDPLIQIRSFISGLLAFLRELIRIRNLVASEELTKDQRDETRIA